MPPSPGTCVDEELTPWLAARAQLVLSHTVAGATPHVPEITLRLGREAVPLWDIIDRALGTGGRPPPYWAFAWPGGQAVARYVLDHPQLVTNLRVLDLGAGSGIVAIAAAKAGAARVMGCDVDEIAGIAMAINAAANGVPVEIRVADLLASSDFDPGAVDVVLAGDIFYDHALSLRATRFLQRCRAAGCRVLLGDPGRAGLPQHLLSRQADYSIPVSDTNQYTAATTRPDGDRVCAFVWELDRDRRDTLE